MPALRRSPALGLRHRRLSLRRLLPAIAVAACAAASPAFAGLSVSPLVIDLAPGDPPRGDVELRNTGDERLYVRVEPARIEHAGLPNEARVTDPDPSALGLIATPGQVILEAGQRKFLRLALLKPPGDADRVFRVTVKPVAGPVAGGETGLKLLVGYDMLVIQRPTAPDAVVTGKREGAVLVLANTGDTNVELFQGRRCSTQDSCAALPSQRLYAGQSVRIDCAPGGTVTYVSKVRDHVRQLTF